MLAVLCAVMCKEAVFCLHVEHGLRAEESLADAEFVRDYCERQGINCRVVSIPPGKIASFARRKGTGLEAAARHFRRKALFRHAVQLGENTFILTAHTKDDMLETALMRVLRGAGPSGLAVMSAIPAEPLHGEAVTRARILRPLLSMTRADVIGYLTEKKIPWREDSPNRDEKFLRNRIRLRLVPLLNESFPSWRSGLAGMAQTQSLASDFIGGEAKRRVSWEIKKNEPRSTRSYAEEEKKKKPRNTRSYTEENKVFMSRTPCDSVTSVVKNSYDPDCTHSLLSSNEENFFAQPEIVREEALFQGIDLLLAGAKNARPVRRSVVRRFCAGLVTSADLGPLTARRAGGSVVLTAGKKGVSESGFSVLIKEPGFYNLKKVSIEVCPSCGIGMENSFYALLPFVLRKSFKDDFLVSGGKKTARRNLAKNLISAVDADGTAAFIGSRGIVLFARDTPQERDDQKFYYVKMRLTDV
jgi:tRNA(Ile)-lysidine synthase